MCSYVRASSLSSLFNETDGIIDVMLATTAISKAIKTMAAPATRLFFITTRFENALLMLAAIFLAPAAVALAVFTVPLATVLTVPTAALTVLTVLFVLTYTSLGAVRAFIPKSSEP